MTGLLTLVMCLSALAEAVPAGTRETAYQRLVRLRREAKAQTVSENLSLGPVAATVPLKMTLWSNAAHQFLQGSRGIWRLPAARYAAVALELNEEDSGALWTFEMGKAGAGLLADFEIRPGEATAVKIGPPFQIRASLRRYSQNVSLTFDLEGQAGEQYRSLAKKNGAEAPEPSFKIVDGSGWVARSGRFEYG